MKAISKSVSMPEPLWAAVEAHAPNTPGRDRSGYIRNLVEADLRQNGPLADGELAKTMLIEAAGEVGGIEAAREILRRYKRNKRAA